MHWNALISIIIFLSAVNGVTAQTLIRTKENVHYRKYQFS